MTPHFSLEELTYSYTATRLGIDNTPNEEQKSNLLILSEGLELVRTKLNSLPISINSGFRCEELNDVLGSRRTSKHILGLAADFTCNKYDDITGVMDVLAESGIPFDQLILEFSSWIHVSFPRKYSEARREVFQIDKKGVRIYNVGK